MGLDFGSKTVGVAISDPLGITAGALEIIRRNSENKLRRTLARIEALIKEYDVGLIVLGLPLQMNDKCTDRALKTLEFQKTLQRRTGLDVIMWDERLTTVEAGTLMDEAGIAAHLRGEYTDKIAAMLILQDYLNNRKD